MEKEKCKHMNFESVVSVGRITDEFGIVTNYVAEVKIKCRDCHAQFRFVGMPSGASCESPMISADGYEARLPIVPLDNKIQ